MIKVRQERFNSWPLEGTWENPQLAKFHERSQWREGVQEHQMSFSESGELKKTNEPSTGEVSWGDSHRREGIQVHKVLQELLYIKLLETHETDHPHRMIFLWSKCDKSFSIAGHLKEHVNPYGREAFQMLKVWQDILEIGPLKELWEDPHRREAFQMFIVWQKLLEIRPLSKPTAEFYVVCRRVGWSGQPHLLTQKCNIKT